MNYTVVWRTTAEEELAAVWDAADDRNSVTAAADEIDRRLTRDPLGFGESRDPGERLAYHGSLAIFFHVDPQSHIVSVLAVGFVRRAR
jgi:hypothetical protein